MITTTFRRRLRPAAAPQRPPERWLRRIAFRLLALGLGLAAALVGVELTGRLAGYDFDRPQVFYGSYPVYYRAATRPVGLCFYHREGPVSWTGRPLNRLLELHRCTDDAYPDEPVITVDYDCDGFRNPPGLRDWSVVVTGDSFTELGYLPYDDLFTTELGRRLGAGVKNLGTSGTSTLAQTCFLEHFGVGRSTRDAVLAYYEGNDAHEVLFEARRLDEARARGVDPAARGDLFAEIGRQTSACRAMWRWLTGPRVKWQSHCHAYYVHGSQRVPLSIYSIPVKFADLPPEAAQVSEDALRGWAEACRRHGLRPWLLYLPTKLTVCEGHLEARPGYEHLIGYQVGDIHQRIQAMCRRQAIGVIDATPALRAEVEAGRWPYNTIYDTHLNRQGSLVVGAVLAEALAPHYAANGRKNVKR